MALPAQLPAEINPCLSLLPAFCLQLFQECSVCSPDSPLEALKQTLERLDAAIFATPSLKHVVCTCRRRPCTVGRVNI